MTAGRYASDTVVPGSRVRKQTRLGGGSEARAHSPRSDGPRPRQLRARLHSPLRIKCRSAYTAAMPNSAAPSTGRVQSSPLARAALETGAA